MKESLVCPRCGAKLGRRDRWCPECGHQETDVVEERFLFGNAVADTMAGIFAALLPMVLQFTMGMLSGYAGGVASVLAYLSGLTLVVLFIGFFTFLRPFATVRRALAWSWLVYTLPLAFIAGCTAVASFPTDRGTASLLGLLSVGILGLQFLMIRQAHGRR